MNNYIEIYNLGICTMMHTVHDGIMLPSVSITPQERTLLDYDFHVIKYRGAEETLNFTVRIRENNDYLCILA